jgi:hypothetical protein
MANLWAETGTILGYVQGSSTTLTNTSSLPNDLYPLLPRRYRQGNLTAAANLAAYSHDLAAGLLVVATNWRAVQGVINWYVQRGLHSGHIDKPVSSNYTKTEAAIRNLDQ